MKIALLDLNHNTRGIHTNTAPYPVGLIARYLQENINYNFDIRLFKDTDRVLDSFFHWIPDIIGISQYVWNSELNLYIAGLMKQRNPECLVVAGGPNLDFSFKCRIEFFKKYPFVDICIPYDGEIPFAEIIRRILAGDNLRKLRQNPVAGSYALDYDSKEIIDNVIPAPRLNNINVFGTIYADGFFDEFLKDGFHPHIQTHRGCPFQCAYCHTADAYYSKMLFLSAGIFEKEMDYLGKRFCGQDNIILYMGNTNMSLFKEDFLIAEIIRRTQDKYNWPKTINVNCGKDPDKLLKMLSIIKFEATVSLQTLTPKVLRVIKRRNIPFKAFVSFMQSVSKKTNEMSTTDLILCLPNETKKTFLATLEKALNSGIENIVVYTLMNLKGTELASERFFKQYKYLIRHRVVPRQFSEINKEKVLDIEEVIVGTNTMSFSDYVDLRGLTFTVTAYLSAELIPLKKLLREYGVRISDWVFGIHRRIKIDPDTRQVYKDFVEETRKELFSSREALLEFFNKEENFQSLRCGKLGDNLLRKYKYIMLSKKYRVYLRLAITEACSLLSKRVGKGKAGTLLGDMELFLSSQDIMQFIEKGNLNFNKKFHLTYNVPEWLKSSGSNMRLGDFFGAFDYKISFTEKAKNRLKNIVVMNKDFELSLQILYRDGTIRDFWPQWELQAVNKTG